MTTLVWSKDYVIPFGKMKYLRDHVSIVGICKYDYNIKFGTLCVMLNKDATTEFEGLNEYLESPVKITTDSNGSYVNLKIKRDQSYKNYRVGDRVIEDVSVSVFTDKNGKTFTSLVV